MSGARAAPVFAPPAPGPPPGPALGVPGGVRGVFGTPRPWLVATLRVERVPPSSWACVARIAELLGGKEKSMRPSVLRLVLSLGVKVAGADSGLSTRLS